MESIKIIGYSEIEQRYLSAVELLASVVCKQTDEPVLILRPKEGVDYQVLEEQL